MAAPHPEYSLYVHDMMARLGIEPGGAAVPRLGMRYATALRRCETCQCKNSCRDWLDCAPPLVNFAPGFCANADLLFELQYDQPGPRRCDEWTR
jgi:hypothetical protein